ncbi:hypothetical protein GCM10011352_41930 [Marinobacterium zhoushanense]|uniref:DUF1127 domain-containing protein n=1 Tax=Marinobacterium zhoushanense TaxID=1679163 RepID=A0ABQ1KYF8_9GAMM|nr:hypothetical protein [Marinobacterium zhoushanense]GGC11028.1 hypothetical protein GCM10011352_41930 [Marinobacterium zhoushanense]
MSTFDFYFNAVELKHPVNRGASRSKPHGEGFVARIYQAVQQRLTEWKYRRQLASLLDYRDAVLEDMGTSRGELIAALELPLSEDAGEILAKWKSERQTFDNSPFKFNLQG